MREERLVELLMNKNYTITTAESCTAGLISGTIVNVSNASRVFNMSFVTYSNESKVKNIGVNQDTIDKYGVVSEQVTYEMAVGSAKVANANCAISVSGIAGPTGDTPTKPIGMVCFGFYLNGKVYTETKYFGNIGRSNVRKETVMYSIDKMIELLEEEND